MQRLARLISRFRQDERGVFLPIFAILAIVLIATSGAVVDFTSVQQARTRAQTALDAATLALQAEVGKTGVTGDTLKVKAQAILTERLSDPTITATVTSVVPESVAGRLNIQAFIVVPTSFVQLVGISSIRANLVSEVQRASSDIEVSVAADITYSMLGSKLTALQDAMYEMIDLLVMPTQTPTYSKMAIAPYSNGVNVADYKDIVRPTIAGITITNVSGAAGTLQTITGISKANPAIVTTNNNHGLQANDFIYVGNITGMTQITEGIYKVGSSPGSKTFKLLKADGTNVNSNNYSSYSGSAGRVMECLNSTCKIVVTTSTNHNFDNGDITYITGAGASYFNSKSFEVSEKTNTTFVPKNVTPLNNNLAGNGGTAFCTDYGCEYYRYTNASNSISTFKATNCAVERTTTTHASLDTVATTAPLGIQYATIANGDYPGSITLKACPTVKILPLTSDKDELDARVGLFNAQGSTAGHIGLAWAWYMLSPDFVSGTLATAWPTTPISAQPGAWKKAKLVKALVLMTDGQFNTMYNFGVPSKDADLANSTTRSNTDAPNGTSLEQAAALCTEIKKDKYNILLYTVGFDIAAGGAADTFLSTCATNASMYKTASDAETLKTAFQDIAKSLSELRLSK